MTDTTDKKGATTGVADETKQEEGKGPLRTKEAEHAGMKAEVARLTRVLADAEVEASKKLAATIAAYDKRIAALTEDNETLESQRDDAWTDREKAFADGYGLKAEELAKAATELKNTQRALVEYDQRLNSVKAESFKLEARVRRADDALATAIKKPWWMFWGNSGIQIGDGPED